MRKLPSVNELLESPPLRGLAERLNRSAIVSTVRTVLDELRTEVQTAAAERTFPSVSELAERIARRALASEHPAVQPVVNATGILLHDGLGGVPLPPSAVDEIAAVSQEYATFAFDLETDEPARATRGVEALLREITGAEAALVLNNQAGATLATLAALSARREVVVGRGQLVELGDGSRLCDLIDASGAVLREVGSTNATRAGDYAEAIGPETAAVMLVDVSSFQMVGNAVDVDLAEVVGVARKENVPLIHHLGMGPLVGSDAFELPDVPVVAESVRAGADLVVFRADRLVGGPQAGIVVGRKKQIERIEKHPITRAFGVGKLTLSALAATLRAYRDRPTLSTQIPVLQLLGTSVENLENRARRIAPQVEATAIVGQAEAVESVAHLTGERLPSQELASWAVSVSPEGTTLDRLHAALRLGIPPVVARRVGDRLLLDLRAVMPRGDIEIVEAFGRLANDPTASPSL